jgi:chemotaxis family two-component system response regulator Rcp1
MNPCQNSIRPIEILLVEDSPSDALLTKKAFEGARLINRLHVVEDGIEALKFLRKELPYADALRPDLILLDLNLPKKDGREVLAEIKEDEDLKVIPVVVLTTSRAEEDIMKSYKLHANCYITKPVNFDSFTEAITTLEKFWFAVVTLPP